METISTAQRDLFELLTRVGERENIGLYLVGGYVRDILLGHTLADKDIDILVDGNAIEFSKVVVKETGGDLQIFESFFTSKIKVPSKFQGIEEIDFASARREIYLEPGKLPSVEPAPLSDDLKRRDFTINAMALSLKTLLTLLPKIDVEKASSEVLDPFSGRKDLASRLIRILHAKSFEDDPTRLFRALRYEVRIGGSLHDGTKSFFEKAVASGALSTISTYRKFTELRKIFEEKDPLLVLKRAYDTKLLASVGVWNPSQVEGMMISLASKRSALDYDLFLIEAFRAADASRREKLGSELNLGKKKIGNILGSL